MSRDAAYWLGKRVRVGAACDPSVTMAEGVVVAYASAPTILVRDEQGWDSTWQVTLPIDVLGEVPHEDLPEQAAVDTVWLVWDFSWMDHDLLVKGTFRTEAEAKAFDREHGQGMAWFVQEVALPQGAGPVDTWRRSTSIEWAVEYEERARPISSPPQAIVTRRLVVADEQTAREAAASDRPPWDLKRNRRVVWREVTEWEQG